MEANTLEGKNRASVALIKKIREQLLELSWNGDLPSTQHWRHILEKAKLNEVGYKDFLRNFFDHEGTIEDFWSSLPGSVPTEKIQRYYRLSQLVQHHTLLFDKIAEKDQLAPLGSPQAWKDLMGDKKELLPKGANDVNQFAHTAAYEVEDWMPSAVYLEQYAQKSDLPHGFKSTLSDLNGVDFSLMPLEKYLDKNDIKIKHEKVRKELVRLERLFHLAPQNQKFRAVEPLLKDGLTSAFSIRRMPRVKFIAKYAEPMEGKQIAQEVYDNAHQRSSRALMLLTTLGLDFNLPTTVTPRIDKNRIKKNGKAAEVADLVGSLDYCDSRHCESVLSPAAYLTDLLAFLVEVDTTDKNTALEKFLKRRPDIANINLNCENTHQALPYIDLILEVLENEVAQISYDHEEIKSGIVSEKESIMLPKSEGVPQTTLETPQLKSYPEHLRVGAYETLKKVPSGGVIWGLPFDLWWEEVRTYLAHLGLNRVQLAEAFSEAESPVNDVITGNRLGITSEEMSIICNESENFAGYSQNIEVLLANNALLFEELEELLLSHFVNLKQKKIQYTNTCSLTGATIDLDWDTFSRFRRLRFHLGWSVIELDRVLRVLGNKLNEDSLQKIATLKHLQEETGLPVTELLSWWYDLDTVDYEWKKKTVYSLYHQIFLDSTLGDQIVVNGEGKSITEVFDSEKQKGGSINSKTPLLNIIPYLSGVLRMEEGDLERLITEELEKEPKTTARLTLENLSYLYRTASFLRNQKLSLDEYWTLCALSGYRPLSNTAGQKSHSEASLEPNDTLKFLRLLQFLREGPFSIEEIDYLIRHRYRASQPFAPTGEKGNDFLLELRDELYEVNQTYDINRDDYTIEELESALRLYLSAEEDVAQTLQIITHISPLSPDEQIAFLEEHFGKIISDNYGIRILRSITEYELSDRINYLTKQLYRYLKPRLEQDLIGEKVAAIMEIPPPIARKLCEQVTSPRSIPDSISEKDSILDVLWHASYTESKTEELSLLKIYPALLHSYHRLYKVAWMVKKLQVPSEDIEFLLHRSPRAWLQIAQLPTQKQESLKRNQQDFNGLFQVIRAYQLDQRRLQGDLSIYALLNQLTFAEQHSSEITAHLKQLQKSLEGVGLIDLFKQKKKSLLELVEAVRELENDFSINYDLKKINLLHLEDSDLEEVLHDYFNTEQEDLDSIPYLRYALARLLKNHTGWKETDIRWLLEKGELGFHLPEQWQDESWLYRCSKIFAVLKRAQAPVEQVWQWQSKVVDKTVAQSVKNAVKAKYTDGAWLKIAPELRNPIREKQRNALQIYVINKLQQEVASRKSDQYFLDGIHIKDKNSLFEYFLLDTEMAPCAMTSRIKQATLSVQLFVQRILMNLEKGTHMDQELTQEWNWRKHYRVWEANRKVFLYPENWLEPELRTDKSPFFEELESELLQDEVTADNVERAYRNYLHKLDQVAHLEPMGMYLDEDQDVLHVFARTKGHPYIYYYRRWMYHQYWTSWEKVEVDIEGDHLLPFVHNRRLFIAWPMFLEKAVEPSNEDLALTEDSNKNPIPPEDKQPKKYYEIRIAWSQYKEGKWSAKQLTKKKHPIENGNYPEFMEKSEHFFPLWSKNQLEKLKEDLIQVKDEFLNKKTVDAVIEIINDLHEDFTVIPIGKATCLHSDVGTLRIEDFVELIFKINFLSWKHGNKHWRQLKDSETYFQWSKTEGKKTFFPIGLNPKVKRPEEGMGASYLDYDKTEVTVFSTDSSDNLILLPYQFFKFESQAPLFFQDPDRTFFILPEKQETSERDSVEIEKLLSQVTSEPKLRKRSSTPIANRIAKKSSYGVSNMVGSDLQYFTDGRHNSEITIGSPQPGESGCPQDGGTVVPPTDGDHDTDVESGDSPIVTSAVPTYTFQPFYHPFVDTFISQLNLYGIEGFLSPERFHDEESRMPMRQGGQTDFDFQATYDPNNEVMPKDEEGQPIYPVEDIDFRTGGAYALYNWELFFHGPWMIAKRLTQEHKFAEARRWFHYIFDPTLADQSTKKDDAPADFQRYWKLKPFYELDSISTIQKIMDEGGEDYATQIEAWEENPFDPHLIAQMRIIAYMKAIVMNYLDNLIAHGDHLFAQETMESINEATQLYVLAAQILGRTPVAIQGEKPTDKRFVDIAGALDAFSNAEVALESQFGPVRRRNRPFPKLARRKDPARALERLLGTRIASKEEDNDPLYFSIPRNDKFLGYWTTVPDRLFKIRHCMNIEGVTRELALFQPPIDPGMLVRARAGGLDISAALSDLNTPLSYYRFSYILQRALDFCNEVKSLGGALLSALEKKDAEALAQLRTGHEVSMLKAQEMIKEYSLEEGEENLNGLQESKKIITHRLKYYDEKEFMNTYEKQQEKFTYIAMGAQQLGMSIQALNGFLALIPEADVGSSGACGSPVVKFRFGGQNLKGTLDSAATVSFATSNLFRDFSSLASTKGGYKRREEEWIFQKEIAEMEQAQIDKQIAAAEIRKAIAEKDLDNHKKQIEQSQEAWDFMKDKYTNQALYTWMTTQLSRLYRESYQMAYQLAKQAEKAFRFELDIKDSNYVQFGHWNNLKSGLLAGELLSQNLKRLEMAYWEKNRRSYELTKYLSLAQLNPKQLLSLWKEGSCTFHIPEVVFDLDHPGHYLRRIKSVSLTIPCVTGPYTSVSAKLTLLNNKLRKDTTKETSGYGYEGLEDPRFRHDLVGIQSIATSHANNDSGLFELNFRDERYLPFEGAGAISTWRLELPKEFQQFDYDTISDVILQMNYTAREGGDVFKGVVNTYIKGNINKWLDELGEGETGLPRLFSLKDEFPKEWNDLIHKPNDDCEIVLTHRHFPFFVRERELKPHVVSLYFEPASGASLDISPKGQLNDSSSKGTSFKGPKTTTHGAMKGLIFEKRDSAIISFDKESSLKLDLTVTGIEPKEIVNIYMLMHYKV